MNINDIRELLVKKEQMNLKSIEMEKLKLLKEMLKDNNFFFKVNATIGLDVLTFLGIESSKVKDVYKDLISPSNYVDNTYHIQNNL